MGAHDSGESNPGLGRRRLLTCGAALSTGGLFWLSGSLGQAQQASSSTLQVDVRPTGVPAGELEAVAQALQGGRTQGGRASASRNLRVISVRALDPEEFGKTASARATAAGRWRALAYDYTSQRALSFQGRVGDTTPEREMATAGQPIPSPAEWQEARDSLLGHPEIGPRLRSGELIGYRPMPPVLESGLGRRLITVGLLPRLLQAGAVNEIVAVDLAGGPVRRFAAWAPETAVAGLGPVCGAPPAAAQGVTGQGVPGQYAITIRRGTTVIWTFTAVRPSASSGLRGSGIELRDVRYRGRLVLARAHLPILNVKYDADRCGPYRDWQYSEGMLQATGVDVAPGFRLASSQPTTIVESGTDTGNFRGTAVWISGEEVTLMAELEAGWYRYISKWTLHTNGTIKPRFGFAAVQNSCVCNLHYHHAYWRFDFDIGRAAGGFVEQLYGSAWQRLGQETVRLRDAALARRWRVGSIGTSAKYEIRPNLTDGRAQASPDWPFPVADLWFLRYRASELDDGVNTTRGGVGARLSQFANGESINGADVVVWYGAHFSHDAAQEAGGHGHVGGPDLVPVNW